MKLGKRFRTAQQAVGAEKLGDLADAVARLKKASTAKFQDPPFDGKIAIELRKTHDHGGWTRKDMLDAMAKRAGLR